jgi:pimeloyl-ACP methyl ester carboxylesterase
MKFRTGRGNAMQRIFVNTSVGQIHVRDRKPPAMPSEASLVALHPCPYSGQYFDTIAPMISVTRRICAPDFPGYGDSAALEALPSIEDYADAMVEAIDGLDMAGRPIDLLGFHTGTLVAVAIALARPDLVRSLILVDVPYYAPGDQATRYPSAAAVPGFDAELGSLAAAWDFSVTKRIGSMAFQRSFDNFIAQLQAGLKSHFGFHAAFTYDCVTNFARVAAPTTVVATASPLKSATADAAHAIADCTYVERPDVTRAVMEEGAPVIAGLVEAHCRALDLRLGLAA